VSIAIFDLDHTLVRGDSFAAFNLYLLVRSWWRFALALTLTPIVGVLLISSRTRVAAVSIFIWCGTVGLSEADLHRLMDEHVARRFASGSNRVCRQAVRALHEHQREGARVFVATGCVAALAERVCRHIGIEAVDVVGSSLRRYAGGWVAERHCFGPEKVAMLRERGATPRYSWVYTDSSVDLPLLEGGDRRFLVNPTARGRRRVLRSLGNDVEVVAWD